MPKKKVDLLEKNKSWVALLKKRVLAQFAAEKKAESATKRTADVQRQLKKAGVKFKTDVEKAKEIKNRRKK